jgi:hypothetical protein
MRHEPDRERNLRAWLITTAEREAWRRHRIEAGHAPRSFDDRGEGSATWDVPDRRGQVARRGRR